MKFLYRQLVYGLHRLSWKEPFSRMHQVNSDNKTSAVGRFIRGWYADTLEQDLRELLHHV